MKELDWRSLVAEETLPALSVETKKVLGLFTSGGGAWCVAENSLSTVTRNK